MSQLISLFLVQIMKIHKIGKDIPSPSKVKYPWHEMEVGDSVLIVPNEGKSLGALQNNATASLWHHRQMTGKKFKTRIMRKENGLRVWRIG